MSTSGRTGADEWNGALKERCDDLLVEAVARLLPKHGAAALGLVGADRAPDDRLKGLVEKLLAAKALPVDRPKNARNTRRGGRARWRRLVVPAFTAASDMMSRELRAIAPPNEWLLASGTPARIVKLLIGRELTGWSNDHITFDEDDVLARLCSFGKNIIFPYPNQAAWWRALRDVALVKRHMDALHAAGRQPNGAIPEPEDDYRAIRLLHVLVGEQAVELRLRHQPLEIGDSGEVGLERRVISHPVPRAGVSAA